MTKTYTLAAGSEIHWTGGVIRGGDPVPPEYIGQVGDGLAAMLATLLISGLVSRLCLAGLELDFLAPEHIPAGRGVPGQLFVRNTKWLTPSFSVRVEAVGAAFDRMMSASAAMGLSPWTITGFTSISAMFG